MAKKKKQKLDFSETAQSASGFGRGLGGALALAGFEAGSVADTQPKQDKQAKLETSKSKAPKKDDVLSPLGPKRVLKLGISKKGRGGKTVTTLQVLAHSDETSRTRLAKALGKALGCRVWLEDDVLCLQGEQKERVEKWVKAQA